MDVVLWADIDPLYPWWLDTGHILQATIMIADYHRKKYYSKLAFVREGKGHKQISVAPSSQNQHGRPHHPTQWPKWLRAQCSENTAELLVGPPTCLNDWECNAEHTAEFSVGPPHVSLVLYTWRVHALLELNSYWELKQSEIALPLAAPTHRRKVFCPQSCLAQLRGSVYTARPLFNSLVARWVP